MGKERDTSSLTPLRATRFAVSAVLLVAALPQAAVAQSAQTYGSSTSAYQSSSQYSSGGSTGNTQAQTADLNGDGVPDPGQPGIPSADGAVTSTQTGTTPQAGTASTTATGDQQPSDETTGSILDEDMRRLNTREPAIDERRLPRKADDTLTEKDTDGIRVGTFILRPSITQSINTETTKESGMKESRGFLQTDGNAILTSDWGLHQLTVTSQGSWQQNISGEGEEQPSFQIDGDLRLDLPQDTTAHLKGGYRFYREDTDDPNAISGADKQSNVQEFSTGASIERDFGVLRGTTELDLVRTVYSDVTLANGTSVSLSDRDQTAGNFRARIGYELSPALIPFIEGNVGKSVYDEARDSSGYARSGNSYGAKAGIQVDLGEKLRGEVSAGYETAHFDDDRLSSIDTATVDANILWSPLRGTNVNFDLQTSIQPSTTPGLSGYVSHALTTTITHQLRDNLQATVLGGVTLRDYPAGASSDETVYTTSAGLIWNINRYLDLTSTVGYELTTRDEGTDSQQWRAGVGLRLKR